MLPIVFSMYINTCRRWLCMALCLDSLCPFTVCLLILHSIPTSNICIQCIFINSPTPSYCMQPHLCIYTCTRWCRICLVIVNRTNTSLQIKFILSYLIISYLILSYLILPWLDGLNCTTVTLQETTIFSNNSLTSSFNRMIKRAPPARSIDHQQKSSLSLSSSDVIQIRTWWGKD